MDARELKWRKRFHGKKLYWPWNYGDVGNLMAVLEEQHSAVDEKGEDVNWSWWITYTDGHVGCPGWGHTRTIEEAKRQAEIWLRGYRNCQHDLKDAFGLLEKAKKYGWESWMTSRLAYLRQTTGIKAAALEGTPREDQ